MPINIKEKVLSNPILKHILEQIESPIEREKTLNAINGLLGEFQGKADSLVKSYAESTKKDKDQ